jgi:hypothetical protein
LTEKQIELNWRGLGVNLTAYPKCSTLACFVQGFCFVG